MKVSCIEVEGWMLCAGWSCTVLQSTDVSPSSMWCYQWNQWCICCRLGCLEGQGACMLQCNFWVIQTKL